MPIRSIQHPGVEIREIDKSQFAPGIVGTYFLLQGYADKGVDLEPTEVASINEFETIYGEPQNEAERYMYYSAKEILRNGGSLITSKLPYNNTISQNYKYIGLSFASSATITSAQDSTLQRTSGYFGAYSEVTITSGLNISNANYDLIVAGGAFPSGPNAYDMIIVNDDKDRITGPNGNEGIFVAIVDPVDAMNVQRVLANSQDSDVMDLVQGINYPSGISLTDFETPLTGTYIQNSVSEDIMRQFPAVEFTDGGDSVSPEYAQYMGLVVCSQTANEQNEGRLSVGILEAFVGSVHKNKRDKATGQSVYIGDIVNAGSQYITVYQNSTFSGPVDSDTNTVLYKASSEYSLLGFTNLESQKVIDGDAVVTNLQNVHEKLSNIDEVQIDVVVDGGVSTIAQFCDDVTSGTIYDPINDVDANDTAITSSSDLSTWRAVCSELISFCKDVRRDCMAILDVPRHLVLEGDKKFIRRTAPDNTFGNTIGPKLQYVTGLNSSHAALYSDWLRMLDGFSGVNVWIPQSVKMAGIYAYNDRVAEIWDAPAGLNRGIIDGVNDLAFNPNGKQADQVYIKSINYAKKYPLDGFIAEGQKTTQVKPSAFDRVNVRRLFLRLERLVYQVARYFVYEPNNLFTRRRLVDVINPVFQQFKNAGGIYDYRIICNETNNTPDVIDRNELKVAILLKPVKTAEFILVDFIATRTGANFDEIVQELT